MWLWTWFCKVPYNIWPVIGPVLVIEPGKFAWTFYQQLQVSHSIKSLTIWYVGINGRCYTCVCRLKGIRKTAAWGQVHHFVSKKVCALGPQSSKTKKQLNGDATCTCRYMQATICGSEPQSLHKAVLIGVQTLVLQHTCPQAAAFLIPFSHYRYWIAWMFTGENTHRTDLSTEWLQVERNIG